MSLALLVLPEQLLMDSKSMPDLSRTFLLGEAAPSPPTMVKKPKPATPAPSTPAAAAPKPASTPAAAATPAAPATPAAAATPAPTAGGAATADPAAASAAGNAKPGFVARVLGATAKGTAKGALGGAAAGTVLPGVGTALGAGAGALGGAAIGAGSEIAKTGIEGAKALGGKLKGAWEGAKAGFAGARTPEAKAAADANAAKKPEPAADPNDPTTHGQAEVDGVGSVKTEGGKHIPAKGAQKVNPQDPSHAHIHPSLAGMGAITHPGGGIWVPTQHLAQATALQHGYMGIAGGAHGSAPAASAAAASAPSSITDLFGGAKTTAGAAGDAAAQPPAGDAAAQPPAGDAAAQPPVPTAEVPAQPPAAQPPVPTAEVPATDAETPTTPATPAAPKKPLDLAAKKETPATPGTAAAPKRKPSSFADRLAAKEPLDLADKPEKKAEPEPEAEKEKPGATAGEALRKLRASKARTSPVVDDVIKGKTDDTETTKEDPAEPERRGLPYKKGGGTGLPETWATRLRQKLDTRTTLLAPGSGSKPGEAARSAKKADARTPVALAHAKELGVDKNASPEEAKKAFREKVKQFHPDAHPNASPEEKKKLDAKMASLTAAHKAFQDKQPSATTAEKAKPSAPLGIVDKQAEKAATPRTAEVEPKAAAKAAKRPRSADGEPAGESATKAPRTIEQKAAAKAAAKATQPEARNKAHDKALPKDHPAADIVDKIPERTRRRWAGDAATEAGGDSVKERTLYHAKMEGYSKKKHGANLRAELAASAREGGARTQAAIQGDKKKPAQQKLDFASYNPPLEQMIQEWI